MPNKKKKIPLALRNAVWNTFIGEEKGIGECFICNGKITHGTFACGHIIAESKGGETVLKNLRPICTSCNSSQGTKNMIEFKKEYGIKGKDINKMPENMKEEKKIKIKKNREEIIKDNLEKLSKEQLKLLRHKIFLRSYKSQWHGIENLSRLFSPRKSDIQYILMLFTKDMLKIICDDLNKKYDTSHKKNELISIILNY